MNDHHMARPRSYPTLAAFLGGWFHQDFDLVGPTTADVVAAFRSSSDAAEWRAIRRDIEDFLEAHPGPADDAFRTVFNPDVEPRGFGQSPREWLGEIRDLLQAS